MRGARSCSQIRIDMEVDGTPGASVPSSGMSEAAWYWCSQEMCDVSRLPSIDCTQLHSTNTLLARNCSGRTLGAEVAEGGRFSAGPM